MTPHAHPSETDQRQRVADIFTRDIPEKALMLVLTTTAAVAAMLHIQNHQEYTEKEKAEGITNRLQLSAKEASAEPTWKKELRATLEENHDLKVENAQLRGELQRVRLDQESQGASVTQ